MKPAPSTTAPINGSSDFAVRVRFHAQREQVYDAIATLEGLRGWWTSIVSGSSVVGDELRFGFDGLDESIVMRVDVADRPSSIHWSCLEHSGLPEWNSTRIMFNIHELASLPQTCELRFRHSGLTPSLTCFDDCKAGWNHFLASLNAYVERGVGMPFGS